MKMRTINILGLLTLLFLLSSCHDNLNKSILEPLTVEELKSEMKKDSDFISFYEEFQRIREKKLDSDVVQAKYGDLTYKRIWDVITYSRDSSTFEDIQKEAKSRYNAQKKDYSKSLDSLRHYWKAQAAKYNPNSYVKIEFENIKREYYSSSSVLKSVNIGFNITALKGTLEQLKFSYLIKSKISEGERSYWNDERGYCILSCPIYSSSVCYWELPYSLKDALQYKTAFEVQRDYDIIINVSRVRINGENIDAADFSMPYDISSYLSDPKDEYYRDLVIHEYIDESYKSLEEYARAVEKERLMRMDSEVVEFFEFLNE